MKLGNTMSKICSLALVTALFATNTLAVSIDEVVVEKKAKNVIILIPDGMSVSSTTLARWYQEGKALNLDSMASGLMRTHNADTPIADSAPAGTAMATGKKSHTGYVGVLPDENTMPGLETLPNENIKRPIATILEGAKSLKKATGLVVTCEIMHATPADFSAHFPSRRNYDALSKQQVYQDIDVVIGGGSYFLAKENRKDNTDLVEVIKSKNYQYVTTLEDFNKVKSGKLWAMLAPKDLAYDFDRDPNKEPSLAEMTQKAIDILSQNPNGFFLMVEGSKVDWAAHANDPIGILSDVLAFDKAVGVAKAFAKKDGNTLVIAASDHGNSGISIGDRATSNDYDKLPLSTFIKPLKEAKLTGEGMEKLLNAERSNIATVVSEYFGISDLSDEELENIKNYKKGSLNYAFGPVMAKRAHIGFTTNGHTGEDIPLYVYAPKTISQLTGTIDNTHISIYAQKAFGLDLNKLSDKLFVPSHLAFAKKGATVLFDDKDPLNPVLVVKKNSDTLRILANTNLAYLNDKEIKLDGVSVYNEIVFYVPQSAVDLIK
ncbi:MAG: alkaline phosphatase [Campylobacteraceae bacterium]